MKIHSRKAKRLFVHKLNYIYMCTVAMIFWKCRTVWCGPCTTLRSSLFHFCFRHLVSGEPDINSVYRLRTEEAVWEASWEAPPVHQVRSWFCMTVKENQEWGPCRLRCMSQYCLMMMSILKMGKGLFWCNNYYRKIPILNLAAFLKWQTASLMKHLICTAYSVLCHNYSYLLSVAGVQNTTLVWDRGVLNWNDPKVHLVQCRDRRYTGASIDGLIGVHTQMDWNHMNLRFCQHCWWICSCSGM